jgi:FixJ family two-component response regulator
MSDDIAGTLLIVDDEANILSSLGRVFRRDGYRLLSASGGREGLELLEKHEVGVILSDQRMPDMTGVRFLSQVRERWPDSVRIVLSGYTELSSVTDSINQGAIYKFLTKPWEDDDLRETVRKAFQLYRVTRENTRLNAALQAANAELTRWNQELERRVADKTREALRNLHVLRVAQEILARLPLAVLGIDPEGYIALSNQEAEGLLGTAGPLLGERAEEVLPESLWSCAGSSLGPGPGLGRLDDGRRVGFWRYALGETSAAAGTALVIDHHLIDRREDLS